MMMYLESWKDVKGRNMHRFWRSTLDQQNTQLVQLLGLELGIYHSHHYINAGNSIIYIILQ